jgi:ligand-binding SRPBCC domain-containing protein
MSAGLVEQGSQLDAAADAVWERVTTLEGITEELMPIMRMTAPADVDALRPEDIVPGQRLFRSWILLFGLIPFDYDDITVVEMQPGRYFHERSTMLSQRVWEHERWVEPRDGGCVVRDRLRFEPRLGLPGKWVEPVIRAIFRHRHRHRRLRRRFGGRPA